jgi:hypothetical protein
MEEKKFEEMVEGGKTRLMNLCADGKERKLAEVHFDSYGGPRDRIALFVLEGSPPRGYLLADYANKKVRIFNYAGDIVRSISNQRTLT